MRTLPLTEACELPVKFSRNCRTDEQKGALDWKGLSVSTDSGSSSPVTVDTALARQIGSVPGLPDRTSASSLALQMMRATWLRHRPVASTRQGHSTAAGGRDRLANAYVTTTVWFSPSLVACICPTTLITFFCRHNTQAV